MLTSTYTYFASALYVCVHCCIYVHIFHSAVSWCNIKLDTFQNMSDMFTWFCNEGHRANFLYNAREKTNQDFGRKVDKTHKGT